MKLSGEIALVTGAARGMGASFVSILAEHGALVIATDIVEKPDGYAAGLPAGNVEYMHLDVADEGQWRQVVDAVVKRHGEISILVNNAGIAWFADLEQSEREAVMDMIAVDQMGVFHGMKAVTPSMKRRGSGSIINIASVASLKGTPGLLAYSACKWAVRGMTKCAALELGHYGIRVNAVHPGMIDTAMTQGMEEPSHLPIPRKGSCSEVAKTVLFLSSGDSSYTTGGDFIVDGGMTIPAA